MIFIYTTCQKEDNAEKLSKMIIEKNLAASVDFWPIKSCRRRDGNITVLPKYIVKISTFEKKLESLSDIISNNHKYGTPMIAGVDVRRINYDFKEWMIEIIH